jgi:phosphomannomutase
VAWFGEGSLQGLRVGLYEHSTVGRELAREVLVALGAEVVSLGRSETFLPVDTEAIRPQDVQAAATWAKTGNFSAIVSMDGDADRPLLSDTQGRWLRGDVLGILVSRILGVTRLAIPVSCNTAAEKCGSFSAVTRTRIGSPFVIAAMEALAATEGGPVAGYEANGGYLLQSPVTREGCVLAALPTRDALLPILAVLAEVRRTDNSVEALLAELPQRFTASDRLKEFPTAISAAKVAELGQGDVAAIGARLTELLGEEFAAVQAVDHTDGLRLTLSSTEVVHLRPSGNAPELRCYAEAASPERAAKLVSSVLDCLSRRWRS